MYDTFSRDVETYFEEVRLLKRGARGSVTLLRHRSTGKRYIFRRFTGSAEVYRKLLTVENDTPESALMRSVKISDGVQSLVGRLKVTPAFIIAKGGITSSDVGIRALGVHRAWVIGQVAPGVPVWRTGEESKFPGLSYVIFPGNVGGVTTLRDIVAMLLMP